MICGKVFQRNQKKVVTTLIREEKKMRNPMIIKRTYKSIERLNLEDIQFENRIVYVYGEINMELALSVRSQIEYLNQIDSTKEITVAICSTGGSVLSGNLIKDAFALSSAPITTVCHGIAASMAAILFALGNRRVIYKSSQLMIHDPLIANLSGSATTVAKEAETLMKMRQEFAELLSERSNKTVEEILELTKQDTFLTAEQAISFGFATEIATSL